MWALKAGAAVSDRWRLSTFMDRRAAALSDRHYPRQRPGARQFMPPGRRFVLLLDDERAVWGVVENLDPAGGLHWRCSLFRNENDGGAFSSELVIEATRATVAHWERRYGALPPVDLSTEIDPDAVRRKRDPGRCFLRAGWRHERTTPPGHGRGPRVVLIAGVVDAPSRSVAKTPQGVTGTGVAVSRRLSDEGSHDK